MRLAAKIFGALFILTGIVWTLQGINILQGSPMTGDPFWAIMGAICLVAGAVFSYLGWRPVKQRQI